LTVIDPPVHSRVRNATSETSRTARAGTCRPA
jgi:hypothetical protein